MDLFKQLFEGVVKPVFEFLERYGLDGVLVASVILLTFLTKLVDPARKHEKRYVWLPFAYAGALVAVWSAFRLREWLKDTVVYGALASAAYNVYAKALREKIKAKRKKP